MEGLGNPSHSLKPISHPHSLPTTFTEEIQKDFQKHQRKSSVFV